MRKEVAAVRHFNRFYTQKIGLLNRHFLQSPFSLTEGRVLYELARHGETTASELAADLGLDAGYLSRILQDFQKRRFIARKPSQNDGSKSLLRLTEKGERAFASINAASQNDIGEMLGALSPPEQSRVLGAMDTIQNLLGSPKEDGGAYLLRPHQPGDMGWVVHRHGVLYAKEYKWDERFEALVAEIVAKFIQNFDPKRERCWIAEKDGEIVGSVFLVRKSARVAQLRLLLVEPKARGLGIGRRLVDECIRFARLAGYKKMTLWTNDVLHAARHIYEAHGFRLVREERHHSFGHDLVAQTWDRDVRMSDE